MLFITIASQNPHLDDDTGQQHQDTLIQHNEQNESISQYWTNHFNNHQPVPGSVVLFQQHIDLLYKILRASLYTRRKDKLEDAWPFRTRQEPHTSQWGVRLVD